jgi:hypothetical protein
MNFMKKGLALCLAMLLMLSVAACGEDKKETPVTAPEQEQTEAPAAPGSNGPSKPEPTPAGVTLSVAALKGPTAMGLVQLVEQFGVVEAPQDEPLVVGAFLPRGVLRAGIQVLVEHAAHAARAQRWTGNLFEVHGDSPPERSLTW